MIARDIILLTEQFQAEELVQFVKHLESLAYGRVWLPELFGREPFATAGYLLGRTERIGIATGIANVYVRDAHATAQARHTLAELSGGRFTLGLGVSNIGLNKARGHVWQSPLAKMRGYLEAMASVQVDAPSAVRAAPLYIAAHGPQLQKLASERTDGVITYLMPPAHTLASRARIGSGPALCTVAAFIAEADPTIARTKARAALRMYMQLDYYHREWRKLGFTDSDFADGGSDGLIDALVGWGDAAALCLRLGEYEAAGASRVIVMPLGIKTKSGVDARVLEQLSRRV